MKHVDFFKKKHQSYVFRNTKNHSKTRQCNQFTLVFCFTPYVCFFHHVSTLYFQNVLLAIARKQKIEAQNQFFKLDD